MPYRQLGYVIFLKAYKVIFGNFFNEAVIATQVIFSFIGIAFFIKKLTELIPLKLVSKIILLLILLFPFFPPLRVANNIASEGLGYGFFLFFIATGLDIVITGNKKNLILFALSFLGLVFMRGQFFYTPLVFALLYVIIHKKQVFNRKQVLIILVFIGSIALASVIERGYHKLKDGFFKPTPLAFVSASTAPIYLSTKADAKLFANTDYKSILERSFDSLEAKGLLANPKQSYNEQYMFFHNNLPKICNQTVHKEALDYYFENLPRGLSEKQQSSFPYFAAEAAAKQFTKTLIPYNLSEWLVLFFYNVSYGLFSSLIFVMLLLIFAISLVKQFYKSKRNYVVPLMLSSLILSNSVLIAFASHSIMRYLFYNYALLFLLFLSTLKLLNVGKRN
jgi:O-antigen ligase